MKLPFFLSRFFRLSSPCRDDDIVGLIEPLAIASDGCVRVDELQVEFEEQVRKEFVDFCEGDLNASRISQAAASH